MEAHHTRRDIAVDRLTPCPAIQEPIAVMDSNGDGQAERIEGPQHRAVEGLLVRSLRRVQMSKRCQLRLIPRRVNLDAITPSWICLRIGAGIGS